MISIDIIEREIRELEARGETTYSQCERLSWLYTVHDHLAPKEKVVTSGGSEFLDACSGLPMGKLLSVMDEHMDALKVVHPREYEALMDAIRRA